MPAANADVARELVSLFDPDDLTAWAELWAEDAVSTPDPGWPEQGPFEGREAIRRQFERLFADWSESRLDDFEVLAESEPWVVCATVLRARGQGSGLAVELDTAVAVRIEDGLIREGHFRLNRDAALEVAGL